jgi:HemX protein
MGVSRWVLDAAVSCYALCVVLLFVDVMQPRRIVNRTALLLLFFVFACETAVLFERLQASGTVPVYTGFDVMLLMSWLILLVALVVNAFFRIHLVLFLVNVLAFGFVVFDAFAHSGHQVYAARQGDVLVLHIICALFSYVAFSFAFVFSLIYLVQERFLREKRWNRLYFLLPSLERLDTYAFRCIVVGFPFLMIAMVLGAIWGKLTLGRFLFMDPKPLVTTILWLMYGIYLILRLRSGWGGAKLIWYNVLCFTGVIVNFVVIGSFSLFHQAAWRM